MKRRIKKRILPRKSAYAIMPVGKKRLQVHLDKERIPRPYCDTVEGFFLTFYSGQAPTRLFVVLIVSVKPFNDEVANHTAYDSY